jgi:hypothetical protein
MIIDIITYTASKDAEAWYKLMLIYEEFREYAKTRAGILKYRELFTDIDIKDGVKTIRIFGKINSIEDAPAIVRANGDEYWYKNDEIHRKNDKPAVIYTDGGKKWYKNNEIHRDYDLPAYTHINGSKCWFINGERGREGCDGKPVYVGGDGSKF